MRPIPLVEVAWRAVSVRMEEKNAVHLNICNGNNRRIGIGFRHCISWKEAVEEKKIILDFTIERDKSIETRRLYLVILKSR